MTITYLYSCIFIGLYIYTFVLLSFFVYKFLYIYIFIYLFVSILFFIKRYYNATSMTFTILSLIILIYILTKKPYVILSMLIKDKTVVIITKTIIKSSYPLLVHFWLLLVKFLPIDQIWQVLGNFDSSQYSKTASTYKKYFYLIKYFYTYLSLVV